MVCVQPYEFCTCVEPHLGAAVWSSPQQWTRLEACRSSEALPNKLPVIRQFKL